MCVSNFGTLSGRPWIGPDERSNPPLTPTRSTRSPANRVMSDQWCDRSMEVRASGPLR